MDPGIFEFMGVMAAIFVTAMGWKALVWGRPIFRLRTSTDDPATNERLAEVEERVQQLSEVVMDQSQLLEDYHERLDFTERLLTQQQGGEPKALGPPATPPPPAVGSSG